MLVRGVLHDIDIQAIYRIRGGEVAFAELVGQRREWPDDALAELIEADGRWRIAHGRATTLSRYLQSVPDLAKREDPLDAALDVVMRSISGTGRPTPDAVSALVAEYPELQTAIHEAAALNSLTPWPTGSLHVQTADTPVRDLPSDFGPRMNDGRQRYRLQQLLGRGGFSQVYMALDRQLSEDDYTALVAIKILQRIDDPAWSRENLLEEATKAGRINHVNVVQVIDRGVTESDDAFIVYEYVDGGDLNHLVDARGKLPPQEAAALVASIARGVHAAHSAGVIHCDIKPGNVLLTPDGVPKVSDFGIAVRLKDVPSASRPPSASHRGPLGNLGFMSPEQYNGQSGAFSVQSDIYALGGLLFLLLTGELPNGATLEQIAATHATVGGRAQPPRLRQHAPTVDQDLEAICRRALEPDPRHRFDSAAALAQDLERWRERRPIAWRNPRPWRTLWLWMRRKPGIAAALTVLLLVAAIGSGVALRLRSIAMQNEFIAKQNEFDAALKQAKLDEQANIDALRTQFRAALTGSLRQLQDERFVSDLLPQVWVYEFVYGPKVLGMPDQAAEMWGRRIEILRRLIAERAGQHDLETLLWQHALAFWLVSAGDAGEALPLIDRNIAAWHERLAPDDPWLNDAMTLRACAMVNQAKAGTDTQTHSRSMLLELRDGLRAAADELNGRAPRTPMHYLALARLADVHDAGLLDEPEIAAALRQELRDLKDDTAIRRTGVGDRAKAIDQKAEAARD